MEDHTDEQMKVIQINSKTKDLLYNAISCEEYKKISYCEPVKEMWDKLEITYKRTKKVKQILISLLVYEYELFKMKDGESIEEAFARFEKIIVKFK